MDQPRPPALDDISDGADQKQNHKLQMHERREDKFEQKVEQKQMNDNRSMEILSHNKSKDVSKNHTPTNQNAN